MSVAVGHPARGALTPDQAGLLGRSLGGLAVPGGPAVRVTSETELRKGVHRLVLSGASRPSVVVKRLGGAQADRERWVTGRWLPAAGLADVGPPCLARVSEADGRHVWHVYEDLGANGLNRPDVDPSSLRAAMTRLADLHAWFGDNPMLAEPRFAVGDLGSYFYARSVRDAARCVDQLRSSSSGLTGEESAVLAEMRARFDQLRGEERDRLDVLENGAGPETLLHGDVTRENVFVLPGDGPPTVRLIDWDHVGVGPAGFDISTHAAYYTGRQRALVLDLYTTAMAERGYAFADDLDWDLLTSTFEVGRLANQLIWIALGILEDNGWTFGHLASWAEAFGVAVDGEPPVRSGRDDG